MKPGQFPLCFLGLGSNLGDRAQILTQAAARLIEQGAGGKSQARASVALEESSPGPGLSPIYETAPVGVTDQPAFLNAVLQLPTTLDPEELLSVAQAVERDFGRDRRRETRWGPRPLDIDLLLYEDRIMDQPGLTLPHPRLHERWFVLKPLCDLAPDLIHPVLQQSVVSLLARLEEQADNPQQHGRRFETS